MIKKTILTLLGVAVVGGCIYLLPFALGKWGNQVESTIGTEYKDIKREQFEHSKSYVHGKTEDLQRYKRELEGTKDEIERKALIILIQDEFATFDEALIDNSNLRQFLQDIRNGFIQ